MFAHDRSFSNRAFFERFFVIHALLGHKQRPARLDFLLKASNELFVRFFWILFKVDHNV